MLRGIEMVVIETVDDIADEIADKLGIYNEKNSERSFFVGNLAVRMREAVENEKMLYRSVAE
jgi:phosphoribosylpyrophosphate synthetase